MARVNFDETNHYLHSLIPDDSLLAQKAKTEAQRIHKNAISISSYEAYLIGFFIRQAQCSRFVELGTLTGYSGLKILEALPPNGHLWTFELKAELAQFASSLFDEAGYQGKYTILVGKAEEHLSSIINEGPFDGIFIDANKSAYPYYLDWSLNNIKSGGLILADNTLMRGVVDTNLTDPEKMIRELRIFNQKFMQNQNLNSIIIPTIEGLSVGFIK